MNMANYELKEDEHADENGLPVCNKCGEKRYIVNPFNNQVCFCLCRCQSEVKEKEKQELLRKQQTMKM